MSKLEHNSYLKQNGGIGKTCFYSHPQGVSRVIDFIRAFRLWVFSCWRRSTDRLISVLWFLLAMELSSLHEPNLTAMSALCPVVSSLYGVNFLSAFPLVP